MGVFLQDLRFAWRQLARRRASTLAAVLTLALGIGANTARFSFVSLLLFAPSPASDPGRLVWITAAEERTGRQRELSYSEYRRFHDAPGVFTGVAAISSCDSARQLLRHRDGGVLFVGQKRIRRPVRQLR